jgi:hypothetical protein
MSWTFLLAGDLVGNLLVPLTGLPFYILACAGDCQPGTCEPQQGQGQVRHVQGIVNDGYNIKRMVTALLLEAASPRCTCVSLKQHSAASPARQYSSH